MTPFPSFPQIQSADLGEGEWKFGMTQETEKSLNEQRRIVAYLDGFPLSRDLRQARLASLREFQSQTQEKLSPSLRFGDASRDALLPSIFEKSFKSP